eukprot:9311102-Alexandrium_andersonii.AAC.1
MAWQLLRSALASRVVARDKCELHTPVQHLGVACAPFIVHVGACSVFGPSRMSRGWLAGSKQSVER